MRTLEIVDMAGFGYLKNKKRMGRIEVLELRFNVPEILKTAGQRLSAALVFGLVLGLGSTAQACRQALVLAIDVSASVSTPEYLLQRDGLVRALRDPQVADWMIGATGAEVELLVFEWGGQAHQRIWVDWTRITDARVLGTVADRVSRVQRSSEGESTGLGTALLFGAQQLATRRNCSMKTIDVSGDGKNNVGPRPRDVHARLEAQGVTVNALVVATRDVAELTAYFNAEVILGPNSFIETAGGFEDYARAIKRKMLRELVPGLAALQR